MSDTIYCPTTLREAAEYFAGITNPEAIIGFDDLGNPSRGFSCYRDEPEHVLISEHSSIEDAFGVEIIDASIDADEARDYLTINCDIDEDLLEILDDDQMIALARKKAAEDDEVYTDRVQAWAEYLDFCCGNIEWEAKPEIHDDDDYLINITNQPNTDAMETYTLDRTHNRPLQFEGERIGTAKNSANNASGAYSGQTGICHTYNLYRTAGGVFVGEIITYSDWAGARTQYDVAVGDLEDMFAHFGHGWLAKELYADADLEELDGFVEVIA